MAEYDNAGNLLRSYIHGQGIDEPVRITDHPTSTNYYYLADGLGSITEIQDTTKATVETYTYDSFGNPTIKDSTGTTISQSAIGNPYAFTSREWDTETGLYYYRARYYDAGVGRFLSEDPILKINRLEIDYIDLIPIKMLYYPDRYKPFLYCSNNPVNKIDPSGLVWWDPTHWPFPGTNYCGVWTSGPGPATSEIDRCCRDHDDCLKNACKSKSWWKIWDSDVANCNKKLNNCFLKAIF